jgi:hypothetical protein
LIPDRSLEAREDFDDAEGPVFVGLFLVVFPVLATQASPETTVLAGHRILPITIVSRIISRILNKRIRSALSVKGFCGWSLSLTLRFEPVWNLNGED